MHLQFHIASAFGMTIAAVLPASALAQESSQHGDVQTHFTAEDAGVKSPVTIPRKVMGILGEEADAMTCCAITTARFRFDGRDYKRYFSKTKDIK